MNVEAINSLCSALSRYEEAEAEVERKKCDMENFKTLAPFIAAVVAICCIIFGAYVIAILIFVAGVVIGIMSADGGLDAGMDSASTGMNRTYICATCGYTYTPRKGDSKNGVVAGTLWKDMPKGWKCPKCGKGRGQFRREK